MREIDFVFFGSLQDHSGRGLATAGMLTGNVGAKIRGIDQTIAQLPQYFCFHRTILLNCKKTATDAALVRNDNEFKSLRFQTPQRFPDARENLYLFGIRTVISI